MGIPFMKRGTLEEECKQRECSKFCFQRWLQKISPIWFVFLKCELTILPIRGKIYFPSPWLWTGPLTCSVLIEHSESEVMLYSFWDWTFKELQPLPCVLECSFFASSHHLQGSPSSYLEKLMGRRTIQWLITPADFPLAGSISCQPCEFWNFQPS